MCVTCFDLVRCNLLLLLLFTAIGFSPSGSSPYTSTHNTNGHIDLQIHSCFVKMHDRQEKPCSIFINVAANNLLKIRQTMKDTFYSAVSRTLLHTGVIAA
jgi:hypothetical protein